jgi:hypothetical protein
MASSHWIATRLAEPWEAPAFGAAGKLNKEARAGGPARRVAARHGAPQAGNPKSSGVGRATRVRSRSAASGRR